MAALSGVLPLVVSLLVAFFGTLLAGHAFASRQQPGMSTFAFAPLGVAGMTFAGLLFGFSPIPHVVTLALAMVCAPLSFTGFTLDTWRDGRNLGRRKWLTVSLTLVLIVSLGLFVSGIDSYVSTPVFQLIVRVVAFGPVAFVLLSHASMRRSGSTTEQRFSSRMVLAVGGSVSLALIMTVPVLLRAPWNAADPLLWVALAALSGAWVYVAEGRVTVRLFASRALTWLILFLGLVAVFSAAARQLDIGLNLPRILAAVVVTLFIGVGFVVVSDSVTRRVDALFAPDRSSLERELESARNTVNAMQTKWSRLERLALAGELSAMVAHEIKNPLAALRGYAELLTEFQAHVPDAERERFQKALTVIRDESDRINDRVQSLLNLVKPTTPALELKSRFSLRQVVSEAIASVESQARVDQIQLRGAAAIDVHGSADGLRSALVNLLRNALESAPTGRIVVELARVDQRATVHIEDDGPGLSAEQLASPIVAFRSTKTEGTGLGLVIAQAGIEACGGTLRFEANAPHGTRAIVDVPTSEGSHG